VNPYERILGAHAWNQVPAAVRALHSEGEIEGTFQVQRGRGLLARLLGWLLRLPPAGEAVPIRVQVEREGERLLWTRWFGTHALRTEERTRDDLLLECRGPFVIAHRPVLTVEGLDHVQVFAGAGAGRFCVRLPRMLAPRIVASVRAAGDAARVEVSVSAPLAGLLIAYGGVARAVVRA